MVRYVPWVKKKKRRKKRKKRREEREEREGRRKREREWGGVAPPSVTLSLILEIRCWTQIRPKWSGLGLGLGLGLEIRVRVYIRGTSWLEIGYG
jgi:hypothetical protein